MPVAPNPLLQAGTAKAPSRTSAGIPEKAAQAPQRKGDGFDQLMARQQQAKLSASRDPSPQPTSRDKPDFTPSGKSGSERSPTLATHGKPLPAARDKPAAASDTQVAEHDKAPGAEDAQTARDTQDDHPADGGSVDARLVAGQVSDAQAGAQLIQAQAEAVAPVLQASVQPAATPQPVVPEAPEAEAKVATTEFDPEADPLADMPTLRLALEQSAQAKGTTSTHASAQGDKAQPQEGTVQGSVNTLASLLVEAEGESPRGQSQHGEKGFSELLSGGLKDLKKAEGDTRVDDFANRLSQLTQAVTAKAAPAASPSNPLQQPLVMNQNAWSEGLVNRVMYLSSQNLKSANIQLEPAELGRLDIRVNVAADQAAQITFVSGHAGVRDALDSQLHRLRELFTQQGLAQPDVNVADQSRQQQQQAQQGSANFSGVAARRAQEEGDDAELASVARPAEQQVVIGDSAVDYYA
ncbi:flagellar hook-length control protein FliK [Pseudomonas sp. S75]|uniref:flagellar hook-length control protein FliK n=1 Tax=unclassified Pseudomonas TaxID=196821 RepID=UPI001905D48A|nr:MULTISPECIES: flagellar hook-length control protein FliK [unclassified Pseudomonas]MBJ9975423.1 flagellar hook-length control protein FliK [Pseudomonas sp. S30]MBK0152603.1 flagellar hook-length control protein FliK [Pseudomonas sp. S75]